MEQKNIEAVDPKLESSTENFDLETPHEDQLTGKKPKDAVYENKQATKEEIKRTRAEVERLFAKESAEALAVKSETDTSLSKPEVVKPGLFGRVMHLLRGGKKVTSPQIESQPVSDNYVMSKEGIWTREGEEDSFKFKPFGAREPILDSESAKQFEAEKIDRQWMMTTELIRQEILTDPKTRQHAGAFIKSPVSETLPEDFLDATDFNPRIARLRNKFGKSLGNFLALPPLPEENFSPDIRNTRNMPSLKQGLEYIKDLYGNQPDEFYKRLDYGIDSGEFSQGMTNEEKKLVATRYRFARDLKMLALSSEVIGLNESGENFKAKEGELDQIKLPSGVVATFASAEDARNEGFINPSLWVKRRQLKDRVYEIQIEDEKYILKEKKTARHTDTMHHGHQPGLTSLEEFKAAKFFSENAVVQEGDLKISWEMPVASVVFPDEVDSPDGEIKKDAFQFTVFRHEQGLTGDRVITGRLMNEIISHREQFEEEYELVKKLSEKFKNDKRALDVPSYVRESEKNKELSFETFSHIKALRMEARAMFLKNQALIASGYQNRDQDGYSFRINTVNNRPQLEMVNFDFEYFRKTEYDQEKTEQVLERSKKIDRYYALRDISGTRMQRAGYLAMLDLEGYDPMSEEPSPF